MHVRTKIIIVISIVTATCVLGFGGYKLFFDNESRLSNNTQNNETSSKTKKVQGTISNDSGKSEIKEEKTNDTNNAAVPTQKSTTSSNKNTSDKKNSDTKKETGSSSKNNSNTNNTTSNKNDSSTSTSNNTTIKKKNTCYPYAITSNTYEIWRNEYVDVPYTLSNYFYYEDGMHYMGDIECDEYDNTLTWSMETSECQGNTSISKNENSFTVKTTCLSSFKVNIYNKIGDNIGRLHLFGVCRPVTSITPKITNYNFNYDQPFHDSVKITTSDFNYTGSENCSGGLSPNFQVTSNDSSIITCEPQGIGIYSCRGKMKGTATATVKMWNAKGEATTTVSITAQQYYTE